MGWYVAFSGIMNVLVLAFAALALTDPSVKECASPVFMFVLVDCVLAVINIIFAFHAQNRLIAGMSDADLTQLTAGDIMDRGWHIIVYDVGFCLYFFVFIGCMIWNIMGSGWTGECKMDSGWASLCAVLGILFVFLTIMLILLYWMALSCEECCGGSQRQRRQQPAQGNQGLIMRMLLGNPSQQGRPAGQPMGQAAVVQGQPVQYGQATPQMAPTSGGYYGHPPPSAPPQQQQQQQQQRTPAQQAMGVGAAVAGAGLNALGGLLQGAGKKMQGGQQRQGGR